MNLRDVAVDQIRLPEWSRPLGDLEGLAASIAEQGVLQPIIVKTIQDRTDGKCYKLITGRRRLEAVKLLGGFSIPAIVREPNQADERVLALVENCQRENVHPLDLGAMVRELTELTGWTRRELAKRIGKSPGWVQYVHRMLDLAPEAKEAFRDGQISASVARQLSSLDHDEQLRLLPNVQDSVNTVACQQILNRKAEIGVRRYPTRKGDPEDPVYRLRRLLCCELPPEAMPLVLEMIDKLESLGVAVTVKGAKKAVKS